MTLGKGLVPPLMIDLSAERCARSVHSLSAFSALARRELEAFLEATARASASVVVVRAKRPCPVRHAKTPRWRAR